MKKTLHDLLAVVSGLALVLCAGTASAEQFAIQVGDTVADGSPGPGAGRIDVYTENDFYTFSGAKGQSIFLEELGAAGSFAGWLRWELKAPSGAGVFASYLDNNHEGRRTLPEDGTYTLRVWVGSANPSYIGTYSFRLRAIPADPTFAIQFGDTIADSVPGAGAGNIEVPGAWDYYTFSAAAGQLVFFETISAASSFQGNLYCELKSPASNNVFSGYLTGGNHPGRKLLPETGSYQLRVFVMSQNTSHVGNYSFRIHAIPPDQSFAIQVGDTVTNNIPAAGAGNIEVPGAWDYYTFNAASGQLVFFETISAASSFQGNLYCELKSPSSNNVFSGYLSAGNHPGRKTLPETGTYQFRVFALAQGLNYVGPYSFRLRAIPPDQTFAIEPGDAVTNDIPAPGAGNIEVPGAQDFYTFNGLAGQSLSFQGLSESPAFAGNLRWEVKTPGGQNLFSAYFGDMGRKTLPETGTYTIRVWVGANNTAYVGSYSFQLYTLPGDVRCAIQKGDVVSDGVPVTNAGRIEEPGGLDTYTFDGLAGQRVNFQQVSAEAAFDGYLYWRVIAPSGSNWFGAYFPGGVVDRRTLPETGTYSIRVYANTSIPTHIGAYSFRVWCEVVARPDQLATLPDTSLVIPHNKFLCNDSLEIGDVATVDAPNSTSALGGILTTVSNAIVYTPPAGFTGTDSFVYRLRGQFGGEATAKVNLRVGAGVNQYATVVSLVREGPSSMMVCLLGSPNQTYQVQQSDNLTTWSNVTSIVADGMGSMTHTYTIESVAQRFYRFRAP